MRIEYFGTAAAEGIPAFGCNCRVCEYARIHGGKDLRLRTQALINDDLLIDFPPDALYYSQKYGVDYNKIKACLITHNHPDHLATKEIRYLGKNYVKNRENQIDFYSLDSGYYAIKEVLNEKLSGRVSVNLIEKFKPFTVGDYVITPLPSRHGEETTPVIYLIEYKDKKILWAHDTGVFYEEVFEFLKNAGKLDFISIDCCFMFGKAIKNTHLNLEGVNGVVDRLKADTVVTKDTVIVINHFSHNGNGTHEEIENTVKKLGYKVSYDGLRIEI